MERVLTLFCRNRGRADLGTLENVRTGVFVPFFRAAESFIQRVSSILGSNGGFSSFLR